MYFAVLAAFGHGNLRCIHCGIFSLFADFVTWTADEHNPGRDECPRVEYRNVHPRA